MGQPASLGNASPTGVPSFPARCRKRKASGNGDQVRRTTQRIEVSKGWNFYRLTSAKKEVWTALPRMDRSNAAQGEPDEKYNYIVLGLRPQPKPDALVMRGRTGETTPYGFETAR